MIRNTLINWKWYRGGHPGAHSEHTQALSAHKNHNTSSVTEMLSQLQWETLEQCHQKSRLTTFFKIQHCLIAVPMPSIVVRPLRPRAGHPHHFLFHTVGLRLTKNSCFPLSIVQWKSTFVNCFPRQPIFFQG